MRQLPVGLSGSWSCVSSTRRCSSATDCAVGRASGANMPFRACSHAFLRRCSSMMSGSFSMVAPCRCPLVTVPVSGRSASSGLDFLSSWSSCSLSLYSRSLSHGISAVSRASASSARALSSRSAVLVSPAVLRINLSSWLTTLPCPVASPAGTGWLASCSCTARITSVAVPVASPRLATTASRRIRRSGRRPWPSWPRRAGDGRRSAGLRPDGP